MSKAGNLIEQMKGWGTAGEIRRFEKALGIEPVDLQSIPDIYDYLDELRDKASSKGLDVKKIRRGEE